MILNILIGIDPYLQPGVHAIYRFDDKQDEYHHIQEWLENEFRTNT